MKQVQIQTGPVQEGWVITKDAAGLTGYSAATIRRLCIDGRIEARKVGRDWLINKESLVRYQAMMNAEGPHRYAPTRNPAWIFSNTQAQRVRRGCTMVALGGITVDPDITPGQSRTSLNMPTETGSTLSASERERHLYEWLAKLPPLVVFRLPDDTFLLVDGIHRLCALEEAGVEKAAVDLREGTQEDAATYVASSSAEVS